MELYLQYGYGMKEHCKVLMGKWGSGTVILSPRDIEQEQLPKYSKEFKKAKGNTLFDPQLYYPRADHHRLTSYDYWPENYSTSILSGGNELKRLIKLIKRVNESAHTKGYIVPGIFCSRVNKDWLAVQETIIETSSSIMTDKKKYATICLSSECLRFEEQLETLLSRTESWDVEGYYVIPEHPNGQYLVDDPVWLSNLLNFCAGLKLQEREVIVGYSQHQMLCLAASNVDAIASGTWLNVRTFASSKFHQSDESSTSRRAKWYYCPQALSEYKIPFLDLAFRAKILNQFAPDESLDSNYASILFKGAQPSETAYSERDSFRHYLDCFHQQCENSSRSSFKKTMSALELLLETAERFIKKFKKHGIRGQDRDFYEYLDVCHASLTILEEKRGFVLNRQWR